MPDLSGFSTFWSSTSWQTWHHESVFGSQKADPEKEASPQVVQVAFEKALIILTCILRLTRAFIAVEDLKGDFPSLSKNTYFLQLALMLLSSMNGGGKEILERR